MPTFGEVLSSTETAPMTPLTGSGEHDDAPHFSPNSNFSAPATRQGDRLTLTPVVNELPSATPEPLHTFWPISPYYPSSRAVRRKSEGLQLSAESRGVKAFEL